MASHLMAGQLPPPSPAADASASVHGAPYRGSGKRDPSRRELDVIDALINSCPSRPVEFFVYASGRVVAKLFYRDERETMDTVLFFWRRRLDGDHLLRPKVVVSGTSVRYDGEEAAARVRALFVAHACDLLKGESVKRCEQRIGEITAEIKKVSAELGGRNRLKDYEELYAKRTQLQTEEEQLRKKMEEFRAAMHCILRHLGEPLEEVGVEKEAAFELLKFAGGRDWGCIHSVMVRECRRLDENLPLYACRRQILRNIVANQVMILIGETGSGKSTQLVQYLADSGLVTDGSVVCTQPRKIAAISLAQRIAEESYGCYAENSVVSYPTYSSSQLFNSKVIFMTDHCLLQHCMNGIRLGGISYIIIDEAHERSLNTDLLLALIKRKLLERNDLKLIIMSATANASKLSDYFCGCSTFYVMARNFPVEVKYVPDISADDSYAFITKYYSGNYPSYLSDVVKMVNVIHKTEDDGAILAFLTSQIEVEWACEKFNDPSAVVLPMHGKLSCEEQNRVFQSYPGKRKIIFSTNVAETSLTIQDVKYVVDSGMVKESKFDASSGVNVLKVCRISQSSANQRAGRAGRTAPGRCYRVYSEHDFQSMQMHQEPEIRKVHLGIACLRILALGVKNVQDFEFIDAPSPKAIEVATQSLIQLGAIIHCKDAFELTETGHCLIKLGIEPRLGKIILDCVSCGLIKEGLVLAAVMTNASSIFCRVGSHEQKLKADCLKVPFCHHDGDLFTLLSVYKEWEDENESKSKWCWQNSINAKSMRRCQDTMQDLKNCLLHELKIVIPNYWLWNPHKPSEHDKSLKKVILASLAENTAMYSGCDQLGYKVALTGQNLPLHPSCSLIVYGHKPSWVVFGEILSISDQYLFCVTAVDYDCLYNIEPPLFDVMQLESQKMHMNVVTGVGVNLLKRLCGKFNNNLRCLVSSVQEVCKDKNICIDVDFNKREIQLFAPKNSMEKVCSIVNDALELETQWLRDECIEKCLYHGSLGVSPIALFGSGAEIKHVELRKRYLTVEISHPNAHTLDDKELLVMVDKHGYGIANFHKHAGSGQGGSDLNKWGKVTFLSPEAAEDAVARLNNVEFHGSLLKVLPLRAGDHKVLPFPSVKAKVCWPRRPSKGVALIACAKEDAEFIVKDCSTLLIGERYVNCEVSVKSKDCVFVTGIQKDITEPEIYDAFVGATKRRILGVRLLRGEAMNNLPPSTYAEFLVREIAPFMPSKNSSNCFWVEVFDYEPRDWMVKAIITFDGNLHLEAANALNYIQGRVLPCCLPWQKIQCQHMFYSSVSCSPHVYFVLKKQMDQLLERFKNQKGVSYNLERNENGAFRIKLSANSPKTIADLRNPLEQLLKGKTISHPNLTPRVLQSRDGIVLMKSVERETRTCIMYDRQNMIVKVFGPQKAVDAAEVKLVRSVLSFHENKQLEIRLRGHNLPPGLMKEVVRRFGPDLQGLKEKVPGVNVILKTRDHILSVQGSNELKQKVEEIISEVTQSLGSGSAFEQSLDEAICPICLCELEEPFKLEECGHDFCRTCLIEQCESAIRSRDGFPLCCTKKGCGTPLLLVDLKSLLCSDKLEELFRASLGAFVASSEGAYRFCPTPDCPSVYEVSTPNAAAGHFVCGACSAEVCTKCHLEYHPFVSCEQYREFKEDPNLSVVEWRLGKEHVKDCPSCSHIIEKVDGCNHVACRCGVHICWVCLESFESSEKCYSHLASSHHAIV
ncbi:ATP-dependent RNA helicase DEAH12, chloroplastic-like [Elaeis guineensis]|uniref:ATP-dependent RNA helicase DEAH12, chloroplastic-like n=1 Tax=Elaeis guineensis var. tenera TaxID=51953 RepID=UPI003C6DA016